MKPDALCHFCNKQITDKNDYAIFNLPYLGFRYMIAHRTCYENQVRAKKRKNILPMTSFAHILNHWTGYVGILILFTIECMWVTAIVSKLHDPYYTFYVWVAVPIILLLAFFIAYLIGYRFYCFIRYER